MVKILHEMKMFPQCLIEKFLGFCKSFGKHLVVFSFFFFFFFFTVCSENGHIKMDIKRKVTHCAPNN